MWSEYVDSTNFIPRFWPRVVSIAERAWSNRDVRDIEDMSNRMDKFRCEMIRRGHRLEPPNGPGMCDFE